MDDHRQTTSNEDQPHRRKTRRTTTTTTCNNKPRGRPYGSKNKPKPPIIITRESPNTLITHFLEIPPNRDIIKTLTDFTNTRQRALCILTASGSVNNITLRQPPPPHQPSVKPSVLNFTGRFEIMSVSGAFLPTPAPPAASGMSVFVASGGGVQGGVLGGKVVGKLMTAGVVIVVVSSFANSPYQRLPLPISEDGEEEEEEEEVVVGEEEGEKVRLAVHGTGEKIETLFIPKDIVNQIHNQELMMNVIPATNATIGSLLHGFGTAGQNNEMPADEFWGGRLQLPY